MGAYITRCFRGVCNSTHVDFSARMTSPTMLLSAAARLESSADVLACVFAFLPLEEKLRLATVSRRWLRLLLVDLHYHRLHAWRAPPAVRRAGDALRSLHLEELGRSPDWRSTLEGILRALSESSAGAQLRTLVLWEPADSGLRFLLPSLTPTQAQELRAGCPRLDASSRLILDAKGPAEAAVLLDALPGRHAVRLLLPQGYNAPELDVRYDADGQPWTDPEILHPRHWPEERASVHAAMSALVHHPRLSALDIDTSGSQWDRGARMCYSAALAAVGDALRPGSGSSLEYLRVGEALHWTRDAAAAAAAGAASAGAGNPPLTTDGPAEAQPRLRTLHLPNSAPVDFARAALGGDCACIQHVTADLGWCRMDRHDAGTTAAAALEALLERVGGDSLETVDLTDRKVHWNFGDLGHSLRALAPMLTSPGCRLHSLALEKLFLQNPPAGDAGEAEATGPPAERPLPVFLRALSANRSLTELRLRESSLSDDETALLAAALAARASPLRALDLPTVSFGPGGAFRASYDGAGARSTALKCRNLIPQIQRD